MQLIPDGLKEEIRYLKGVADRAGNLKPVASRLYKIAQDDFAQRFASSPDTATSAEVYGGVRWQRLSEAYLRQNPRRRGKPQLIDTKELLNSFKRGKPGNIATVEGDTVEFGSSLPKAEWLHRKRPLMVMHRRLVSAASEVLQDYILENKK